MVLTPAIMSATSVQTDILSIGQVVRYGPGGDILNCQSKLNLLKQISLISHNVTATLIQVKSCLLRRDAQFPCGPIEASTGEAVDPSLW
jgi:hypothetical protein